MTGYRSCSILRVALPPNNSPQHKRQLAMADTVAKELFAKLQVEHGLGSTVTAWLTSPGGLGAKTLDDLLYACTEDGVENLVNAAKPENLFLETSRLRQAYRALKRARDDEDIVKHAGHDTIDMDDLLATSILDDIEARHWARYKMTWPLTSHQLTQSSHG